MTIQESLDRLVDILSSVDIDDLSEAYPHIAEALEIDTEGVDVTDKDAMVNSIREAVALVESDDVDAVVEEINNFFSSDDEELDEVYKKDKKKMKEQDDEEDGEDDEEMDEEGDYKSKKQKEKMKSNRGNAPSFKKSSTMKEASGALDAIMSKVGSGEELTSAEKKQLSAAIGAATKGDSDEIEPIMKKVSAGEELTPAEKKKLSAAIDAAKNESYFINASDLDVAEDVGAMLNGEELSEEFQEKAKTIFEAAVVNKVNEKVQSIIEEFDDLLEEKTQELEEEYAEKLDEFLNYVVQEWVEENKLAITSGIQSEMTESFINSLRDVFDEHYIEIPEEKMNVVEDLQAKVEELEKGLNEALESNSKLNKQLLESKREDAIDESMEGLSDYQKEKLRGLLENVELDEDDDDLTNFKQKAETIRENYFPQNDGENITEELDDSETEALDEDLDPTVARYASALSRLRGNR